jgi:hypothetical protein
MSTLQFQAQTVEELRELVEGQDGLAVVTMDDLKRVFGYIRPGAQARRDMSRKLHTVGLGHFPVELPSYQYEEVRLYDKGLAPLADIVQAVLEPSALGDDALRRASSGDAAKVLAQIRALIAA